MNQPPSGKPPWLIALIVLVAVVVLVAAGVVVVFRLLAKPDDPKADDSPALLLKQVPGEGAAPKYGTTSVYDACSLVTMDKLNEIGVRLSTKNPVNQHYLDGDVPAAAAIDRGAELTSFCGYSAINDNDIFVTVHQAPFTSAEELAKMRKFAELQDTPRSSDGLTIAAYQADVGSSGRQTIVIWKQDFLLDITFTTDKPGSFGTIDAETLAEKLETVAQPAILAGPTAPMRHVYEGPAGRVRDACSLLSKTVFQRTFPGHAGEAVAMNAGYAPTAPLDTRCSRSNIVEGGTTNQAQHRELTLKLSIWDDERKAKEHLSAFCSSAGTGETCMWELAGKWSLWFQAENVTASVEGTAAEGTTGEQRRDELLPAAQMITQAGLFR